MLKSAQTRKAVAATFLAIMLTNTFAPTISYALTSGPTAPEANSFEPVDTSDMVNLFTGDLTYNIPLVEIPGPAGGYPLSLSYHAGIEPNVDASWVGLGWTLNPGAITRDVNGYPDDYNNVKMTRRDFWQGGSTTTYQFGVSVGLAGSPASLTFGLSVAHDTYKGFGVGLDAGVGAMYGPLGLNASVGINPYGGGYAAVSASIAQGLPIGSSLGLKAVGTFTLSTNFQTIDGGASGFGGLSYSSLTLGANMSSNGIKPSLSDGGLVVSGSGGNSNAGRIQTSSHGFGLSIPLTPYFGVYLGRKKVRYWSDETLQIYTNGALNMQFAPPDAVGGGGSNSGFTDHAYDTYHLYDNVNYNMIDHPDAREALGGSFPDNDYYNVSAQGLGGNIRPYAFQEELYIQRDKMNSTQDVWQWIPNYYPSGSGLPYHYQNPSGIQYRFINDFSNKLTQTPQPFTYLNDGFQNWVVPNFDPSPSTGDGLLNGYNPSNQELAGSRHIEYIPNVSLLPGASHTNANNEKFFDPTAKGFQRRGSANGGGTELENSFNNQIGGYKITNESGVTYHYMLPAYSGNEYIYTRANGDDGTFNMQQKGGYYAYAWYLTGVTGPDYVDANNDGVIDEGDWGYWVSFEYGKWCDGYIWRNPESGYQKDLDIHFESQSAGQKELYYLNKVKTATHSAIFEKSMRYDGKGVSSNTVLSQHGSYALYNGGFDGTSKSTLSLDHILLLNNADADALGTGGGSIGGHYAQNIFDASDIPGTINARTLRTIDFNYDYTLCPNTVNSYDYSNPSATFGKLTLKSLAFNGKGAASIMPPVSFNYEGDPTEVRTGDIFVTGNPGAIGGVVSYTGNTMFTRGDILKYDISGTTYYCLVTSIAPSSTGYTVLYLNNSPPQGTYPTTATTTKNPPYNKDAFDSWNMYKCDYIAANAGNGENAARATTQLSSMSYDAWSLRAITSSLGSRILIRYEADSYQNAVLDQGYKIQMYNDPDPAYFYNSNTDNMIYYVVRNPEIFDRPNLQVGNRFDAVLLWYDYGGQYCQTAQSINVIDTRDISDCYLEVGDLSRFDSQGIIGFRFNNVLNFNSFPLTCARMPFFANLKNPYLNVNHYGGNLRVRSIASYNPSDGQIKQTSYNYNAPSHPSLSSGVTSYEPTVFDDANFTYPTSPEIVWGDDNTRSQYRKKLYTYNSQYLSMARELPPPGVMYEYVTLANQVLTPGNPNLVQVEGSTTYQFEVFNPSMLGITELSHAGPTSYPGNPNPSYNTIETRAIALKNYTTGVGNLKDVTRYDAQGKKLSETISHYLYDGMEYHGFGTFGSYYDTLVLQYGQQGLMEENFTNIRYVQLSNDIASYGGQRKAVNSTRMEFPSIMTGQTTIDYKMNTVSSSQNLAFDFYSGALTQKLDVDVYGNRFLSKKIPAYRIYPEMGMRLNGMNNKNMLTQEAGDYMYKVDANNVPLGLVNASAQVWGKSVDVVNPSLGIVKQDGSAGSSGLVWRRQGNYAWEPPGSTPDGITPNAAFTDFPWSAPSSSVASWKKTSETTLYDNWSHELEGKDINGTYSAARMTYNGSKVELTGSPCNYYEIAYSGAEDGGIYQSNAPFVQRGDGVVTTASAHTGASSLQLGPSGQKGFVYTVSTDKLSPGRNYMAGVWVKPVTGSSSDIVLYYDVNGIEKGTSVSSGSSTKMAGGWVLINLRIDKQDIVPGSTLEIGCRNDDPAQSAYVDDLRFQPANSSTSAYVYDPFSGELNYILNNNDLFTKFEYDPMGRLVKTYKETFSRGTFLVSQNIYNYGAGNKYGNAAISRGFTKNDCPPTSQGGLQAMAFIQVPAGMFVANTQADADGLALAYAQSKANQQLGCPVPLPPPVYARIFTQFLGNSDDGCVMADYYNVYIGFYQDEACTIPATVSALPVTFTQGDIGGAVYQPQSVICSGTQQLIAGNVTMDFFDYCYFHSMTHFFQLDPGDGYIIEP